MRSAQDTLKPIQYAVTIVIVAVGVATAWTILQYAIVASLPAFPAQPGTTDLTGQACVTVAPGTLANEFAHVPILQGLDGVRRGTVIETGRLSVCRVHVGLLARLETSSYAVMDHLLLLCACGLVLRIVWLARRDGLLRPRVARATTWLGWTLAVGAVIGPEIASVVRWLFLRSALDTARLGPSLTHPGFLWTVLIVGVGVITFARVLRVAAALQEEAELTV